MNVQQPTAASITRQNIRATLDAMGVKDSDRDERWGLHWSTLFFKAKVVVPKIGDADVDTHFFLTFDKGKKGTWFAYGHNDRIQLRGQSFTPGWDICSNPEAYKLGPDQMMGIEEISLLPYGAFPVFEADGSDCNCEAQPDELPWSTTSELVNAGLTARLYQDAPVLLHDPSAILVSNEITTGPNPENKHNGWWQALRQAGVLRHTRGEGDNDARVVAPTRIIGSGDGQSYLSRFGDGSGAVLPIPDGYFWDTGTGIDARFGLQFTLESPVMLAVRSLQITPGVNQRVIPTAYYFGVTCVVAGPRVAWGKSRNHL